jgi:hypothetical protein
MLDARVGHAREARSRRLYDLNFRAALQKFVHEALRHPLVLAPEGGIPGRRLARTHCR